MLTTDDFFAVLGVLRAMARARESGTVVVLAKRLRQRPELLAFLSFDESCQVRFQVAAVEAHAHDLGARLQPFVTADTIEAIDRRAAQWFRRIFGACGT